MSYPKSLDLNFLNIDINILLKSFNFDSFFRYFLILLTPNSCSSASIRIFLLLIFA
jgi:hypothetical protein